MRSMFKKKITVEIDKSKQAVSCKRCGVMYKPRWSESRIFVWMDELSKHGGTHSFRNDEEMLLKEVGPQDFCPGCEVTLNRKRGVLVEIVKREGF